MGILIEIAINLYISLGSRAILTTLNSSNLTTRDIFPCFGIIFNPLSVFHSFQNIGYSLP